MEHENKRKNSTVMKRPYDAMKPLGRLLGVFALPNILNQMYAKGYLKSFSNTSKLSKTDNLTKEDKKRCRPIIMKSTVIGSIIGAIPGAGAGIAAFMAYNEAKRTSKCSQLYGEGELEGIAAPEAANNAKEAGGLLTTMAFGIPGTGTMAIIMAALMVLGLQPGPTMLTTNTTLCITMLTSIAVANLFAVVMVWFGAPFLTKVTQIKPSLLFATIIPLVFLGAYAESEILFDLFAVIVAGAVGTCMKRYGYSAPALILGFVLGGDLEYYLWKSLDGYGPGFIFSSGISTVLFFLCLVLLFNRPLGAFFKKLLHRREPAKEGVQ